MDSKSVVAEARSHFLAARDLEAKRPFGETSEHWDFFARTSKFCSTILQLGAVQRQWL